MLNNQTQNNIMQQVTDMRFVDGIEQVYSYYVSPGSNAHFFDRNKQSFYIKTVDATGNVMPIREFEFKEVIHEPEPTLNSGITLDQISQLFDEKIEAALNKRQNQNGKHYNNNKKVTGNE